MARLILTYNKKVLSNHLLASGREITIGRDPKNKISIDHTAISQHHAKIISDGQGLHLSDLGSTNGTIVNDEKVMSCQLAHQDWIVIGKHLMIVDLYETLSFEAAAQMLKAESSGVADADGTMLLNMEHMNQVQSHVQILDFISFMSEQKEDFELTERSVSIGKNKDVDIAIKGLWTFLAGKPTAKIEKHSGDYYLEYVAGMLKPKINNTPIQRPTKLKDQDVIKIGPLIMQMHRTRLALSPYR